MFFKHKNIIEVYAVFDDPIAIYLIMELAEDGSLEALMKAKNYNTPKAKLFSFDTLRSMFKEILTGIEKLHSLELVHRDLKPGNIVIVNVINSNNLGCL